MELKEIKQRSDNCRFKILNYTSNHSLEFNLVQEIVREQKTICDGKLKRYAYIIGYEYCVIPGQSNTGKGDLIFTDGEENYMIIEVKYINLYQTGRTAKNRRTKKRKHVKEQTKRYMKGFAETHLKAKSIKGLAYTNEYYHIYELDIKTRSIKFICGGFS